MKIYIGIFILAILVQFTQGQSFHINTDSVLNKIPPFGYSMETGDQGQSIIGNDGEFDSDILDLIKKIEVPILRFPGGTYAHLYEWKRAIGAKEKRGGMHGWKHIPDNYWFGPDEAAQLMEQTNGGLTIVVSFNKGAKNAADWVEYMNAEVGENPNGGIDWAQVRADNGHPESYNVKTWEIGNEAGNSRTWDRWPTNGDLEENQIDHGSSQRQDMVIYGGIRTFTNQKLVRYNAWDESYIKTKGTSNEKFQIKFYPVLIAGFSLKIGTEPSAAISWERVDDFDKSGAEDLHYMLNAETGEVIFSNGENGAIPIDNQYVYADYTTQQLDGHVQFYDAMKAIDSTIVIGDGFWFVSEYASKDPDHVKTDGKQFHMAGETMEKFQRPYNDVDFFKNCIALATGGVPDQIDLELNRHFNNHGEFPNLFFSEYSIFKKTWINGIQYARTIAGALYFALVNYAIAQRGENIQMGCINYLISNGAHNKEGAIDVPKLAVQANGLITEMYTRYFGDQLVSTVKKDIPGQSYHYDPFPWGTTLETHDIPKLYCHSSIDTIKNEVYVMVINSTMNEELTASLSGEGRKFKLSNLKYIKKLSSTSLLATNADDITNNIDFSDEVVPKDIAESLQWDFPAASITCFVFGLTADNPTAIGMSDFSKRIHIYPNPVSAQININFLDEDNLSNMSVYDLRGSMILERNLQQKNSKINVSGFSPGIYVLKFIHQNNVVAHKILKK